MPRTYRPAIALATVLAVGTPALTEMSGHTGWFDEHGPEFIAERVPMPRMIKAREDLLRTLGQQAEGAKQQAKRKVDEQADKAKEAAKRKAQQEIEEKQQEVSDGIVTSVRESVEDAVDSVVPDEVSFWKDDENSAEPKSLGPLENVHTVAYGTGKLSLSVVVLSPNSFPADLSTVPPMTARA
jgi:hypothetical protein